MNQKTNDKLECPYVRDKIMQMIKGSHLFEERNMSEYFKSSFSLMF